MFEQIKMQYNTAPKEVEQKESFNYKSSRTKIKNNRKKTKGRNVFYTQKILFYDLIIKNKMKINTIKSKTITHRKS